MNSFCSALIMGEGLQPTRPKLASPAPRTKLLRAPRSIDDPARCAETLRAALATPGPVVIEALVDPHEPPMPPKATMQQMAKLAESLARGTPNRGKIALKIASDTVRELV
jgi:hypothetical protein